MASNRTPTTFGDTSATVPDTTTTFYTVPANKIAVIRMALPFRGGDDGTFILYIDGDPVWFTSLSVAQPEVVEWLYLPAAAASTMGWSFDVTASASASITGDLYDV